MSQIEAARLGVHHLLVLHNIARWRTATAAADFLGITSSAISHRLREAERRVGVQLTTRHGSGMRLTEAGERLAQSAGRIIEELARAEMDAVRLGRGTGSVVRIGVGIYSYFHWLPAFLKHLEEVHPDIKIEVAGEATHRPFASLSAQQVDVMLMPGSARDGFLSLPAFEDELVCVTSPMHRLARCAFVSAADLNDESHITYSSDVFPGFEYDQFFRPAGHYPGRLMNIAVPEAVIEMVEANLGISILSRWAVSGRLKAGGLSACRLTRSGLPLKWQVATRNKSINEKPVMQTAEMLASWLANSSTTCPP